MMQDQSKVKQNRSMALLNSESFKTPRIGKQQNKNVLEEDGIKCFDLENQTDDLRLSLCPSLGNGNANEF